MKWFRIAVDQGYVKAYNNLGVLMEKASYKRKEMDNNCSINTQQIPFCYHLEDALVLYRQGTTAGCPQAMASLGYLLAKESLEKGSSFSSLLVANNISGKSCCMPGGVQ